jgi:hypothetical protein
MSCRARLLVPGLVVLIGVACQPERDSPTAPSLASANLVQSQVSGSIRGPDGTSICNFVAPGSLLTVRTVPLIPFAISGPTQSVTCPTDSYSFLVDSGDYRIRVTLPVSANLPWRWLEPGVVKVDGTPSLTKDLTVLDGVPLGGGVTLDGSPVAGVPLTLSYGINQAFGAGIGQTGAAGTWVDNLGRSLLPLQAGEQYVPFLQCDGLGVKVIASTPALPFVFPAEASSVNCQMETSVATQYTNTAARMAVGSFPGDIGGRSGALFAAIGSGYGVQFPVSGPPVQLPVQASHLFRGGLIISGGANHILTGYDAAGYTACVICQDLGLNATVGFDHDASGARVIRWKYDDAGSSEGLGLSIVQHSIDNTGSADYVLFRYGITNTSGTPQTFFAGFFGDWDVELDGGADEGNTTLDGRLMYVTNPGETGIHAGTLMMGARPAGHYFSNNFTLLSPDILNQIMSGSLQQRSITCCTDVHYYQSVGPIRLTPGQTRVIWIAVVLGDDLAQIEANATAAAADIQSRSTQPAPITSGAGTTYRAQVQSGVVPVKNRSDRRAD